MKANDGTEIRLELTWRKLYQLEKDDPDAFNTYTQAVSAMEVKPNEMDAVRILYTGYLCAMIGAKEKPVPFEEFLDLLPLDHLATLNEYVMLYRGKKK